MKEVLELWINTRKETATIGTLQKILEKIDRWDVLDDTRECFGKIAIHSNFTF